MEREITEVAASLFTPIREPAPQPAPDPAAAAASIAADGSPAPRHVLPAALHTRHAADEAAKQPALSGTKKAPTDLTSLDVAVASLEKRPRVICAHCPQRGYLWCKRCELSFCYDCWGRVDHHNPGDALQVGHWAPLGRAGFYHPLPLAPPSPPPRFSRTLLVCVSVCPFP
jgi:hypothetical protein